MKVTVVPAQVTTVEDRIMGNLGFSQMILLVIPVFVSAALYAILPPAMGSSGYKYVLMMVIAFVCVMLAIRIKGRIVASWLVTILRYNLRPKYYLFDKNTAAFREPYEAVRPEHKDVPIESDTVLITTPRLGLPETAKVLATIDNPAANVRFEMTRKGGINVRLTEIED